MNTNIYRDFQICISVPLTSIIKTDWPILEISNDLTLTVNFPTWITDCDSCSPALLVFSVIHNFGWFWIGTFHKNIRLILEFLKAPFLVLHFFYYTLMTLLMMLSVILLSMLMILLSNLCHQASDLWQQEELASGLESDLQDTVKWGREKT